MRPWLTALAGLLALIAAGCATTVDDLRGLADRPPIDRSVLVTGGAFLQRAEGDDGTFPGNTGEEAVDLGVVVDVLRRGAVFQRVLVDEDPDRRRRLRDLVVARRSDREMAEFLQAARAEGVDLLLVVEDLRDGPIESFGTNGRWPVTFVTWILLGVGALIPDRTFESRATLRVSLRELQTGNTLHDLLLAGGPVELSLAERSDIVGLLLSIVVPPFWVGDDRESVRDAVGATTERRLLLSLARELKSEAVRRRLDENVPATIQRSVDRDGERVVVESYESLSVARLNVEALSPAVAAAFEQDLLGSQQREGARFLYRAKLPREARGRFVQVLVATLRGGVASATFGPSETR